MGFDEIIKSINNKEYRPVYLLHGEEPYYIDQISSLIESNVLNESEKSFNQAILYGKETDFKQVVDEASQFPMMSSYRVVIVKEAQEMKSLEMLEKYTANPSPTSILVICHKYKKVNGRFKWLKNIHENGIVFESNKIYENNLPQWITQYLQKRNVKIDQDAKTLIAEYLGTDLSKVSNELDKMILNLGKTRNISVTDVQEQIGISKDYNVFEFQKAIGELNNEKVFRIIRYFASNESANPLVMILASLHSYFMKLWITDQNSHLTDLQLQKLLGLSSSYFVIDYKKAAKKLGSNRIKRSFQLLKKADLQSKGYNSRNMGTEAILTEWVVNLYYETNQ